MDWLEKFLDAELSNLNLHLPLKRKSLEDLLKEDEPQVILKNREIHYFDKKEIEKIASILPKYVHPQFYLPIILLRVVDYGKGVYTINEGKRGLFVLLKLTGETDDFYELFMTRESNKKFLNPLDIVKIRKALPTTTVIGFASSK